MNQCKRLKGSDRARQFCCKKITAGMNAAGWPLPVFCERLADSTWLGDDLKNGGRESLCQARFLCSYLGYDTLKEICEN